MLYPGAVMSGWYRLSPGNSRDESHRGRVRGLIVRWHEARSTRRQHRNCASEFVGSVTPTLQPAATLITHGATLYGFRCSGRDHHSRPRNTTVIPRLVTFFCRLVDRIFWIEGARRAQELFTNLDVVLLW